MSEPVNVFAPWPHYVEHTAPIFAALPPERRGRFMVAPRSEAAARAAGLEAGPLELAPGPLLLAGAGDEHAARRAGYRRFALIEHGAGQSYGGNRHSGESSSYAGGNARDGFGLFLHPNEHAAARDRARYPGADVEVVGSPVLDTLPDREPGPGPVVAVTFHADMTVARETAWAFPWIRIALRELAKIRTVIGTGHPRAFDSLATWYAANGIEPVRDFRDVCRRADVLIFDNTSAGFAFAATGRPVAVLNPPYYRPDVEHGLRFWGASSVGVNVWDPSELPAAVDRALEDAEPERAAREAALAMVYAHRSGAAARAAAVLEAWA